MPNSVGPGINEEGLIFAYDTGDTNNSFIAPPHENLLTVFGHSYGGSYNNTGFIYESRDYEMIIPKIGRRPVKGAYYWNNYPNGTGNTCCPNLFYYHAGNQIEGIKGNTLYTYSIIYKHTGHYTHPNFMYRYERREDGSYIKEGGLHSTGRRTHLGEGWYHAWGQFTTHSETRALRCYSFLYNYQQHETFYVAGISLVEGDLIIPPQQMTFPGESISTTEALKDLTGTKEIILSNVSFDQNANITFDGTDDWINLGQVNSLLNSNAVSAEFILDMATALDSNDRKVFHYSKAGTSNGVFQVRKGGNNTQLLYQYNSGGTWYTLTVANAIEAADQYYHFVFTHLGNEVKAYRNGTLLANGTFAATLDWADADELYIGYRTSAEYWKGNIDIAKFYNRALSADEVLQNYNALKGRFNI